MRDKKSPSANYGGLFVLRRSHFKKTIYSFFHLRQTNAVKKNIIESACILITK
jgi:hypothetical protein